MNLVVLSTTSFVVQQLAREETARTLLVMKKSGQNPNPNPRTAGGRRGMRDKYKKEKAPVVCPLLCNLSWF